eukprot:6476217-Amphidinium_carterae.1
MSAAIFFGFWATNRGKNCILLYSLASAAFKVYSGATGVAFNRQTRRSLNINLGKLKRVMNFWLGTPKLAQRPGVAEPRVFN